MGPYSEERQMKRAEAVEELLSHPNLTEWAKNFWSQVAAQLSRNEDTYNWRVKHFYSKARKGISQ